MSPIVSNSSQQSKNKQSRVIRNYFDQEVQNEYSRKTATKDSAFANVRKSFLGKSIENVMASVILSTMVLTAGTPNMAMASSIPTFD